MSEYAVKINQTKKDSVKEIQDSLASATDYIFTDYRGLTVAQITELRNKLRAHSAEYHVVKNTYARLAFRALDKADVDSYLVGPTAVALAKGDSGIVAKELLGLTKEWPLSVKGGLIDGKVFNAAQVEAFSKLLTKIELIAQLMGTMKAPLQNFVYVLNGVTTKLVRTLAAVAEKKAKG